MRACHIAIFAIIAATASLSCVVETNASDDDDGQSSGGHEASVGNGSQSQGVGGSTATGGAANASGSTSSGSAGGEPAFGASSAGMGGPTPAGGELMQAGNVRYRLIAPAAPASPVPLLLVFSGVEGGQLMTQNLLQVAQYTKTDGFVRAVLDGVDYNGNGGAGATVLDALRGLYDIDNDRTYLLGESAGTSAAMQLGFELRQSYFAAYWANDINAGGAPAATTAALGFQPWGQVGPGGQQALASQIVEAMRAADYRLDATSPYAGPGASQHGNPDQFLAAMSWFAGKTRQ